MTFKEFMDEVYRYKAANPGQREGQAVFNVLSDWLPWLADKVYLTSLDTFYDDRRLDGFYRWLRGQLDRAVAL